jgi:hypothetical protein
LDGLREGCRLNGATAPYRSTFIKIIINRELLFPVINQNIEFFFSLGGNYFASDEAQENWRSGGFESDRFAELPIKAQKSTKMVKPPHNSGQDL